MVASYLAQKYKTKAIVSDCSKHTNLNAKMLRLTVLRLLYNTSSYKTLCRYVADFFFKTFSRKTEEVRQSDS